MQKIWIDNTLLQSMHVHELRHINTKYLYTDIIMEEETTMLFCVNKMATKFSTKSIYLTMDDDSTNFSCPGGDIINFDILIKDRDIYIVPSMRDIKNKLYVVYVVTELNHNKDAYNLVPLF